LLFYTDTNFFTSVSISFESLNIVQRSFGTSSNAFLYRSSHVGKHVGGWQTSRINICTIDWEYFVYNFE